MSHFSRRLELLFLLAFILFLPLFEAPKNLFWLAYAITWVVNRSRARDFGGRWDLWDSLASALLLSAILAAVFAGIHKDEWRGVIDVARYVALFSLVRRARYTGQELKVVGLAVVVSTLIALAYAYWSHFVAHTRPAIELNSVGHVNHSSIYLVVVFGAALSAALAYWRRFSLSAKIGATSFVAVLAASVIFNESRAAVASLLVSSALLGFAWLRRSRKPLAVIMLAVLAISAVAFSLGFSVIQKHQRNVEMNLTFAYRDLIWNGAWEVARRFPVFGVGMENFGNVGQEQLREYVTHNGGAFDPAHFYPISHAHNVYLNTLAERGVVGLVVLLAVLFAWLYWMVKRAPRPDDADLDWALWGSTLMAWLFTTSIGLFNTTLHHEHALLTVLLLGMWLARVAATPAAAITVSPQVPKRAPRRKPAAATRKASRIS